MLERSELHRQNFQSTTCYPCGCRQKTCIVVDVSKFCSCVIFSCDRYLSQGLFDILVIETEKRYKRQRFERRVNLFDSVPIISLIKVPENFTSILTKSTAQVCKFFHANMNINMIQLNCPHFFFYCHLKNKLSKHLAI